MSDLDARAFTKRGKSLVPSDFVADEFLAGIKDGQEVLLTVRKARSPSHHRWFFALLRKVVENTESWQTEDQLLDALKLAVGHTIRYRTISGAVYEAPRSISFAAMPEDAFNRFRKRCCYVLATKVLGCTPEELMAETDETQSPSVVPERERETA